VIDGEAVSRKFKPIPNDYIRNYLAVASVAELDGELMVGPTFQSSSSGVMSEDGEPDFTYHVFDIVDGDLKTPFKDRYEALKKYCEYMQVNVPGCRIKLVEHTVINNMEELLAYESKCLAEGYEGVMMRSLNGPYKLGRSTVREGFLLKLKRFVDQECEVIGFEEKMHNANEATKDELGHTKRSSHQENMIPMDTLGAFILRTADGVEFNCGCFKGFDDAWRKQTWDNRDKYLGKLAKIKSQPTGVKDKLRFPVFLGWREQDDL
jgi:DNA ligase-1